MNERVGVQAFHRTGARHCLLHRASAGLRRREREDRAQTLPSREHAVPHRLVQRNRPRFRRRDALIERCINDLAALGEVGLEVLGHLTPPLTPPLTQFEQLLTQSPGLHLLA